LLGSRCGEEIVTAIVVELWSFRGRDDVDPSTECLFRVGSKQPTKLVFPSDEQIAEAWREIIPNFGAARMVRRHETCLILALPGGDRDMPRPRTNPARHPAGRPP
jgi:hypothetical protein